MKGGIFISGIAHVAMILLAIWGLPQIEEEEDEVQFSQVEIISVAEFDAIRSAAPAVEEIVVEDIAQPEIAFNPLSAPAEEALPEDAEQDFVESPSEQDEAADLTDITTRVVEPDVATEVEAPQNQQETQTASLPALSQPSVETPRSAPSSAVTISRPPQPRQAPQIDTSDAPPPPEDEPEETPEEPEDVPEETPDEPEIAEETPEPSLRPQRRPDNIAELAALAEAQRIVDEEKARLEAEQREQEREEEERLREIAEQEELDRQREEDAEADRIAAAINNALNEEPVSDQQSEDETATVPQDLPLGAQLNFSEREGLRLAVQSCWNPPIGIQGAGNLQVTVAIELKEDGTIATSPELISPIGSSDPGVELAFEAARRALIKCGRRGFNLPADKFGRWQKMEVTFDPQGMVGW